MIFNSVSLLITNRCTMQCPHCCLECHPENRGLLSNELIEKIVLDLKENPKIEMIGISGGEAFLYLEKVKFAICMIKKAGKASAIYTNAFWCNDYETTYTIIEGLKKDGLTLILTSVDSYHQEQIHINNVKNLLNVCQELDIRVKIHVSTTYSNAAINDSLLTQLQLSKLSASITQSAVFPVGRASKEILKEDIISIEKRKNVKCTYDGMCSIDWDGNVFWCCSIHNKNMIIGNVLQKGINSILNDFRKNKVFMCMHTKGLSYLANKVEQLQLLEIRDSYASSCELCNEIYRNNELLRKLNENL